VTRDDFIARLRQLGLSQTDFAWRTGVVRDSVYHWGASGGPFPLWVDALLAAWEDNQSKQAIIKRLAR